MKSRVLHSFVLLGWAGLQTASASLILETYQQYSVGTGLGNVATDVTFQAKGSETGCVGQGGAFGSSLVNGVCTGAGNTKTGASQSLLEPLSAANVGSASDFALVFNGNQPAGGPLAVSDITVAFYDPSGAFLYQSSGLLCQSSAGGATVAAGSNGCLLSSTAQGTGQSGFLVTLDARQQAAAIAAGAFANPSNLVGVSAAAGAAAAPSRGGPETIYLTSTGGGVIGGQVPEPATYVFLASGLGLIAISRRKLRRS